MGDRERVAGAAAVEGKEELYRKGEGGGIEALWEFEGAYGCVADGDVC